MITSNLREAVTLEEQASIELAKQLFGENKLPIYVVDRGRHVLLNPYRPSAPSLLAHSAVIERKTGMSLYILALTPVTTQSGLSIRCELPIGASLNGKELRVDVVLALPGTAPLPLENGYTLRVASGVNPLQLFVHHLTEQLVTPYKTIVLIDEPV